MIISNFEVQVTSPEGVPFHEVLDPNKGEIYVVAEAGKSFELRYRSISPSFRLPSSHSYTIRTRIDSKCVGIARVLKTGQYEDKHVGFVRHGDKMGITYDLFKFASAVADEGKMAESLDFKQGKMEVVIQQQMEMPGERDLPRDASSSQASRVPSLPEGKKFFLAPSLTTASAGVKSDSRGFSSRKYVDVGPPAAKFSFRYETASTLLLRKILRRENPVHAAILNSFPETRIASDAQPETSVGMASTVAGKHHSRVKRERGRVSSLIKNEVIDLVDPPRVSLRVAQNLAPNEELECDLTGDDDAPQWAKRRKPEIEIDDSTC